MGKELSVVVFALKTRAKELRDGAAKLRQGWSSIREETQDEADMYEFTAGEFETLASKIELGNYKI